MAIGPEQLEDKFKEELNVFEAIIDRNLKNSSFANGGAQVMVTAPTGMQNGHFQELRQRYLVAGWKEVRREFGHQRDPLDAIVFTK